MRVSMRMRVHLHELIMISLLKHICYAHMVPLHQLTSLLGQICKALNQLQ